MGWVSYGLPALTILVCLVVNNSIILIHVLRQTRPFTRTARNQILSTAVVTNRDDDSSFKKDEAEVATKTLDGSASDRIALAAAIDNELNKDRSSRYGPTSDVDGQEVSANRKEQARRLRLVSSQAFLYVVFYLRCNVWTGVVAVMEATRDTPEEEMEC